MCHCDSRVDNLIDIIHAAYRFAFLLCVYANMLIFVPMLLPSPQMLCLSLIIALSLVVSSLSPSHIKMHGNLFSFSLIAIKSSDKHHCFTQRAEHNRRFNGKKIFCQFPTSMVRIFEVLLCTKKY
jgi:hypothetical protein